VRLERHDLEAIVGRGRFGDIRWSEYEIGLERRHVVEADDRKQRHALAASGAGIYADECRAGSEREDEASRERGERDDSQCVWRRRSWLRDRRGCVVSDPSAAQPGEQEADTSGVTKPCARDRVDLLDGRSRCAGHVTHRTGREGGSALLLMQVSMMTRNSSVRGILLHLFAAALVWLPAGAALAGGHTWDVNEVFSDPDGEIQFIELWEADGGSGENGVGNGTISSNTQSHSFGNGPVEGDTTNKFYLIATQSFADLPGAPTPDEIIPEGTIPFFDVAGDTVAFGGFDSWLFESVPTNGTDSLDRFTGVGANSPTNYAGQTGSVDANESLPLPLLGRGAAALLFTTVGAGGYLALRRRAHA